ncbi:MAG TPA: shikimate dehydrogenase [Candidatus Acidoferrum sp.]|nr:shikimate dehydrogenase [Candidatus Acidoferrum sp.]
MTDRYAVMGNPVAHSKSPLIHAQFARETGQDLIYEALLVEHGRFPQAVRAFFAGGGKGLNITVPFKLEAWALAEQRSEQAELAGAVNVLFLDAEGVLQGHNTDGIGMVRDITQNHGGVLQGKSILILGAGGATRGIVLPLLQQRPAGICIANRTVSKAQELVPLFASHGQVHACGYDDLRGQRFDWVFNATAASLQGELPPLPADLLNPMAWCYDLMYAKEPTIFCRWAQHHGAHRALDGLGMLVEQAAESFWLWRGVRPQTAAVLQMLR